MRPYALALLMALLPLAASAAEVLRATPARNTTLQYARLDVDITLRAAWTNPFHAQDVAVDVVFTAPSGRQLRLPAFHVSGEPHQASRWQARFAPREVGRYGYRVEVSEAGRPKTAGQAGSFAVTPSAARGFLRPDSAWALRFDNGEIFRGIGENFCWEHRDHDDSKYFGALHENPRFNYETMMAKLSGHGANFIRTWMIYWNLPVDWRWVDNASRYRPSEARFNESGIARMDAFIVTAEQHGIYVMLALDPHVALLGEGWERSVYNRRNGGHAATVAEFFTSPKAREQYQDKLRFMVARWGYSPAIAAWEFFNEIDNVTYADPAARIPDEPVVDWHRAMSRYLAEVDPFDHLITTSISHRDLAGLNDIPDIDFNQKHIYKATGSIPATVSDYVQRHGKPYVIGESGFEWDWSKNFDAFAEDMVYDFKRGLWYGLFSPTPILPLSWWWEYFDEKQVTPYFAAVREIDGLMRQAGRGRFEAVAASSGHAQIEVHAVRAGRQVFIYLNNASASSQQAGLTQAGLRAGARVRLYDPETRKFRAATVPAPAAGAGTVLPLELGARQQLIVILPSPNAQNGAHPSHP